MGYLILSLIITGLAFAGGCQQKYYKKEIAKRDKLIDKLNTELFHWRTYGEEKNPG